MATLAKAPPARLAALLPDLPAHTVLRPPEVGAVMVRGRIGATGAPFNLGEMTVTRASVRLASRRRSVMPGCRAATRPMRCRAAVADALMQTDAGRTIWPVRYCSRLRPRPRQRATHVPQKAAGTKVDFFTMVRGEDK